MKQRIVITGMGLYTSLGGNLDDFFENLIEKKKTAKPIPNEWKIYFDPQSPIYIPLPDLEENSVKNPFLEKTSVNFIYSAKQALRDANLSVKDNFSDFGLYVGTASGGLSYYSEHYKRHILASNKDYDGPRLNLLTCLKLQGYINSASIANELQVRGDCKTFSYACSSSMLAIGYAFAKLKEGKIKYAIVGGTEYVKDTTGGLFRGFDMLNVLTKNHNQESISFSDNRDGFIFSEGGAGCLIMETYENAKRRNARIYAEVLDFDENFEGYSILSMEPDGKKIKEIIQGFIKRNNLNKDDIDFVNAHAPGTVIGDQIEAQVLIDTLGSKVNIGGMKSILGHTFGASSCLSVIATCLSMEKSRLIPTLFDKKFDDRINIIEVSKKANIKYAICNSFAFGGFNASVLLKKIND